MDPDLKIELMIQRFTALCLFLHVRKPQIPSKVVPQHKEIKKTMLILH